MAKLNVNVTIEGVEYAKVVRGAQEGDVIKTKRADGDDITMYGYYEVFSSYGALRFSDDAGDSRLLKSAAPFEVYGRVAEEEEEPAPVAETTPSPYVIHDGKVYVKESRTVEIDDLVFSERTGRIYTVEYGFSFDPDTLSVGYVNGAYVQRNLYALNQVATEKRQAAVGERIVIVAPYLNADTYNVGDVFTVTDATDYSVIIDKEGRSIVDVMSHSEYVVLKPDRLAVGDYAKVGNYPVVGNRVTNGDIVKVTLNDLESNFVYRARILDGTYYEAFSLDQLTLATDAEVKAAQESVEAARKAAEVSAKWAKIGRKVNEFKSGDIVESTRRLGDKSVVTGIVDYTDGDGTLSMGIWTFDAKYRSVNVQGATLITPVEQRFDR